MFFKRAMSSTKLNPKNFPRPPLCERTNRHLQIKWKGEVIVDTEGSEGAYWVLETFHPPTYYISPTALKVPAEKSSSRSTFCEWKGNATYWDIAGVEGKCWTYDNPSDRFKGIKGYLSFYAAPWDCYVDGEKVEAQPGDFYGGWMTSDIEQESVKGAPGTRHW